MKTRGEGRKGKQMMEKCVRKEEWCYLCYIGGLLLFCDQEECINASHPKCIGEDDSFVNSGKSWTCDAHSCFVCHKGPGFNCVGCPKALCRRCFGRVEFVQLKGNKGLCSVCLKFGLLVEEKKDADFDKQFMEHFGSAWKIISERECLTLEDLRSVEDRMRKGKFYISGCDLDENEERVKSDKYDTFPKKNKEKCCSVPRVQYALINPKNITLVYLKKRLVEKLVKEPRILSDNKLIGSFVKIKADRNDRFDKNIFKLLQVTGTTWTWSGENDPEKLLHVSGMENKISINLLSDGDVNEYECNDLKIRIQHGLLKQPTVVELEQKARILHEDITKHWIVTELERLQIRFELAYERGRKSEMIEFEKKRERLLKSDEQENLLNNIPHVVAAAEGELELLSKNVKDMEQEDGSYLKTPHPDGSCSGSQTVVGRNSSPRHLNMSSNDHDENAQGNGVGKVTEGNKGAEDDGPPIDKQATLLYGDQAVMGCNTSSERFNVGSNDVKIGGNCKNAGGKITEDLRYKLDDLSKRFDRTDLKTYSRRRQHIATSHSHEISHLQTNPTAEPNNDKGDEVVDQSTSSDRTKSIRISPVNDGEGEHEKIESSAAGVTGGNKRRRSYSQPIDE